MANCDMCGKNTDLYLALIEGAEFNVCKDCAKFGKVIAAPKPKRILKYEPKAPKPEITERIVPNFSELIRKKREEMGLSHEDFAKKINEKVSLVHHLETGKFEPSISMAYKLEHILKIKLVEREEGTPEALPKPPTTQFTIGDLIKVKKG